MTASQKSKTPLRLIPAGVWAVGFVSMFMDISSEMIHALLPVYLVTAMGASAVAVGFIEGIAEATASIVKIFSGALSDWLGRRKLLALTGYGLAAATKPIFPLAPTIGWVVGARFVDRIGKGIRGAPRDALVADITPPHLRGGAFGLRQALDTFGAFAGPLIAIGLMIVFAGNFRAVFWVAVIPAIVAVSIMAFAVREPPGKSRDGEARFPLQRAELAKLSGAYWLVVILSTVFSLARFSEAFLILRARDAGLSDTLVPLVLVVMNAAYALAAYPAGAVSDRVNRLTLLGAGIALLIAADAMLALAPSLAGVAVGVVLWGLHMAFTQGLLSALVADTAGPQLRGTAFGIFNLTGGLALLGASVAAGLIWDIKGASLTFAVGGGVAALAIVLLAVIRIEYPKLGSVDGRN